MGLSLLANASIPLKIWDQAFLTATHLINRTPTKLLNYDMPLHRLVGATPDYSNIRVFGCACWSNLRPYNSHKLQFRSTRCAFLGYSNLHKGYKCLDISNACVYISHNVVFDEAVFPFAQLPSSAGASHTSEVLFPESSRLNSDLPVHNIIPNPNLVPQLVLLSSVFQPQTILSPRSASARGMEYGGDPAPVSVMSLAVSTGAKTSDDTLPVPAPGNQAGAYLPATRAEPGSTASCLGHSAPSTM
jgi:hypothetical protein